jgi:hypothetical protein
MDASPLRFDVPVGPDQLIDRRDELAELGRSAGRRTAVRLAAPRRFGKTSLLHAHVAAMRAAGHRATVVDLSDVGDLAAVLARVAHAYRDLDPSAARLVSRATRKAGLTVGPSGLSLSLERSGATYPGREQLEPVLLELLDLPARLHRADDGLTVVCFDEFQDLLQAGPGLDGALRSVIQHHGDAAAYVYAGSHPSLIRALFTERERPLFGQALPLELGPLPEEETIEALSEVLAAEGFGGAGAGAALDLVVHEMRGHPQRTLLVCEMLLRRLQDGATDDDPDELCAVAIADALRVTDDLHRATWRARSAGEAHVLRLVAEGVPPTGADAVRITGLASSTLGEAVERLVDDGQQLVRAGRRWALVDPLLALWLRRSTT